MIVKENNESTVDIKVIRSKFNDLNAGLNEAEYAIKDKHNIPETHDLLSYVLQCIEDLQEYLEEYM